ncbi:hypothetical protein EXIGLDRAFT_840369 [Exidia glandulosa HHB12029]|uniref:AAA-ATPase-like domain-containing protein n=1 Tax=Exidia glandulosa HHB12029 TaxID=1314781 RepID=A0A165EH89_EXIGL|nr:hypothetical protein EXIGLDRAFT_840369 [Exidia glandulosa HHB12029]
MGAKYNGPGWTATRLSPATMPVPKDLACGITNHETFYMYRVRQSSCVKLERPTVGQFIADLRAHHDAQCACGATIGDKVWLALYRPQGPGTVGLDTSAYKSYGPDCPLEQFSADVTATPAVYHLLVEGTQPAEEPPPPEQIQILSEYGSSVFRIPGAQPTLFDAGDIDYGKACAQPGTVIVDKSSFVDLARSNHDSGCIPVLRRPTGFGKTMFLSMFEAYVDTYSAYERPPFPNDPSRRRDLSRGPGRFCSLALKGLLLVLHLDLAHLHLMDDMEEPEMRTSCRKFLAACALACYKNYQRIFVRHTAREAITLSELFDLGYRAPDTSRFFVGVDNYTAPLLRGDWRLRERVIVEEIFSPLLDGFARDTILRGLIVGGDVPGIPWPYCSVSLFRTCMLDLSYDPVSFDMLGVDEAELVALGKMLFIPEKEVDLLRQVRLRAGVLESAVPTVPYWGRAYSTRDVLAVVRALLDGTPVPESVASVTGANYRPPIYSLRPELVDALYDAFVVNKEETLKSVFLKRPASPQQEMKKKPRESDPVSDDGSWPDSDRASAATSFIDSPPPSSLDSDDSDHAAR